MWTLLRLVFWLFIFALVVWFSTNVPLGTRTLWGHLRAIGSTKEAQELADGTKAEAKRVADKLFEHSDGGTPEVSPHVTPHGHSRAAPPLDDPSDADRHALDKLTKKNPRPKP